MTKTVQPLETSIKRQLDANKARNLLFENVKQIMDIDPDFLAALEELVNSKVDTAESAYSEFVAFTANELVKRLHAINPYVQVTKKRVKKLEDIYRQTWQVMKKTGNVQMTLKDFHYPELSKWLASLYPEKFQEALKGSPSIRQVTYGEYSAELQIDLLGIDIAHIKQPVIDVGCGNQANLVRYLRALNIETYGLDRYLEIREPHLTQTGWFEYEFERDRWGTVISHMGFSNHLNYAYLHDLSQLENYLLKMKEIMESLVINGCFYYAPSLPFVEDQLSTQKYAIQRKQTIGDVFVSKVIRME